MLERTDAITNEVPETIAFVLVYPHCILTFRRLMSTVVDVPHR